MQTAEDRPRLFYFCTTQVKESSVDYTAYVQTLGGIDYRMIRPDNSYDRGLHVAFRHQRVDHKIRSSGLSETFPRLQV